VYFELLATSLNNLPKKNTYIALLVFCGGSEISTKAFVAILVFLLPQGKTSMMHTFSYCGVGDGDDVRLDETWHLVSNFAWLQGYHYLRETNLLPLLFTLPVKVKPIYHKSPFLQCFENMAHS